MGETSNRSDDQCALDRMTVKAGNGGDKWGLAGELGIYTTVSRVVDRCISK